MYLCLIKVIDLLLFYVEVFGNTFLSGQTFSVAPATSCRTESLKHK